LVSLYKEFPHHEDVLEPFNQVIARIDPANSEKRIVNLLIDREGNLCVFRKLPAWRRPFVSLDEACAMDAKELKTLEKLWQN